MSQLMHAWSEQGGRPVRKLQDIPLHAEDRAVLDELLESRSGAVSLPIGSDARQFCLELREHGSGWLLALRDEGAQLECERLRQRMDRFYALAAVIEGLVHDLNNILGAAAGYSEHMAMVCRNPDERMFLESVKEGTRSGADFANTLLRLVRQPRKLRRAVSLTKLVEEALSVFRSTARLAGLDVRFQPPEAEVLVRVVPEDAIQTILHMLLFSRASSPKGEPIELRILSELQAGGGARRFGLVNLTDRGDVADGKLLGRLLEGPCPDVLDVARRVSGDGRALLHSALAMMRSGGKLRYDGSGRRGRSYSLLLPIAQRRWGPQTRRG